MSSSPSKGTRPNEPRSPKSEEELEKERRKGNLIVVGFLLLIVVSAIWRNSGSENPYGNEGVSPSTGNWVAPNYSGLAQPSSASGGPSVQQSSLSEADYTHHRIFDNPLEPGESFGNRNDY
jgi:hypothetical protein